jgi:hypothetical protein
MLGALGGDEDPIPPGDINPHPMPMGFDDIWMGGHGHAHAANAQQQNQQHGNQQQHVHQEMQQEMHDNEANAQQEDINQDNIAAELPDLNQPVPVDMQNQMTDSISALQGLISSLVVNANELLPKLGGAKIINASCKIVDVEENNAMIKKCFLQVNTVAPAASQSSQPRDIVELSDDDVMEITKPADFPKNKRKKKAVSEISLVRRSERIAKLNGGYRDVASATAAGFIPLSEQDEAENEEQEDETLIPLDLAPKFEAVAMDHDAPPPPHLPLKTVQAIGTGLCQMPSQMVSDGALMYDSSNDSS